jgi:FimV-like protein
LAREPATALSGFYRVRPGESLGGIANDLITQEMANSATPPAEKPSVAQRMLAIYRANPKAFAGSMHQLLDGAELRLPSAQEIAAIDPLSARLEIRDQTSEYLAEQARTSDTTDVAPVSEAERTVTGLQHALRRKDLELAALRAELDQLRVAPASNVSGSNASPSNASASNASASNASAKAQAGSPGVAVAEPVGGGSSLGLPNPAASRTSSTGSSPLTGVTTAPVAAPSGVFSPSGLALGGGIALLSGLIGLWLLRQRGRGERKPAFRTSGPAVTEPDGAWKEAEILQRMPDLSGFSGLGSSNVQPGSGMADRPSAGVGRVTTSKGT